MKIGKTRIFTTLVIGLLSISSWAQQDAAFSMYFFNPLYVNPGYAESRSDLSGTLVHRGQWVGIDGAPASQSINVHGLIPYNEIALGLQVYNDKSGPVKNTGIQTSIAYHLPVGEKTKLSFGLQGTINSLRIAWDQINIENQNDQSFTNTSRSLIVPDASSGLYLYSDRLYSGLSVTHLFQSRYDLNSSGTSLAKFYRHYYFTSGYVFKINETVDFRPSIMMKFVHAAPLDIGANASFILYKKFFAGIGIRTSKRKTLSGMDTELIAMVEYEIGKYLRIGYAFDAFLNPIGKYNRGTHEIMLGWDLNFTKTKLRNSMFF